MKPKHRHLTAMTCAAIIGTTALSQAAVILAEDFTYADGALGGQSGGTGFSNAWTASTVTGGVVTGNTDATRDFTGNAFPSTGTIWISFDWGNSIQASQDGSFGGLTFYEGASERLLIGNTWVVLESANRFWHMNGAAATTVLSSVGMKTGVAKITLGTGATSSVELWVGATGSPVDVSGAPLTTTSNRDLDGVNRFRINGQDFGNGANNQSFDNLLVGTTMGDVDAIPEPSTALLGGLGLLALLRRRR